MSQLRSCALTFCAVLVWSQSPAIGQGPDGPFGLKFGASAKTVSHRRTATVDLAAEGGVSGAAESCRWDLFNASRVYAPEEWQIDPRDIGRDDDDVRRQMRENNLRINYGSAGRLKAGIYSVLIDSRTVPVCLVFFDDRLFFVHVKWDPVTDDALKDKAEVALQGRYGPPVSVSYGKTWVSRGDQIYVDADTLDLTYVYAPVAKQQLVHMFSIYDATAQKKGNQSGF